MTANSGRCRKKRIKRSQKYSAWTTVDCRKARFSENGFSYGSQNEKRKRMLIASSVEHHQCTMRVQAAEKKNVSEDGTTPMRGECIPMIRYLISLSHLRSNFFIRHRRQVDQLLSVSFLRLPPNAQRFAPRIQAAAHETSASQCATTTNRSSPLRHEEMKAPNMRKNAALQLRPQAPLSRFVAGLLHRFVVAAH